MLKEKLKKITGFVRQKLSATILPGFEGQDLYTVLKFFFKGLTSGYAADRAASVTFRFLIALFPLIIVLFSLIPYVPIEGFQESILSYIEEFFPKEVYAFFSDFLDDLILRKRSFVLSISFLLTIFFASNSINSLLIAFEASSNLRKRRAFYIQRAWSLGLLVIFFVFSILITLVMGFSQWLIDWLYIKQWITGDLAYYSMVILKYLITFLVIYMTINLLYQIGHTERDKWRNFTVGAMASTLLIILLQEFFSLYLTYFGKFDQLYGHLGAALAFLLFLYYFFYLLILGFELNVSIHKARTSRKN